MAAKIVICDTDVFIDYWKEANPRHFQTVKTIENKIGFANIAMSAISEIEIVKGAINKANLAKINQNLATIATIYINDAITVKAISLINTYSLSHNLGLPDAFIAATAIITDFELFTYNTDDYKFISGLTLFKP